MDICKTFGLKVKGARLSIGISQEELAGRADSNRTYISDLERGTRNPSIRVVKRIADALGVSMGELLDEPVKEDQAVSKL